VVESLSLGISQLISHSPLCPSSFKCTCFSAHDTPHSIHIHFCPQLLRWPVGSRTVRLVIYAGIHQAKERTAAGHDRRASAREHRQEGWSGLWGPEGLSVLAGAYFLAFASLLSESLNPFQLGHFFSYPPILLLCPYLTRRTTGPSGR